MFLRLAALSRHHRNHLRARGLADSPNNHEFDVDMFDVPEFNCTTEVWREQIDGWDIVGHELDAVECQESTQYKGVGLQCLCRAFFSTGAIIGHPHYICQHCDLNDTTDE